MSFLTVFIPSLVLTAIIGAFQPLTWRVARAPWALATFWGIALLVHVGWLAVPLLGAFAPVARWLAITWLATQLIDRYLHFQTVFFTLPLAASAAPVK